MKQSSPHPSVTEHVASEISWPELIVACIEDIEALNTAFKELQQENESKRETLLRLAKEKNVAKHTLSMALPDIQAGKPVDPLLVLSIIELLEKNKRVDELYAQECERLDILRSIVQAKLRHEKLSVNKIDERSLETHQAFDRHKPSTDR